MVDTGTRDGDIVGPETLLSGAPLDGSTVPGMLVADGDERIVDVPELAVRLPVSTVEVVTSSARWTARSRRPESAGYGQGL